MHDGDTGCLQWCEKELFVQIGYKYIGNILTMQEKINYFFKKLYFAQN
jgi:hypothetical protein